MPRSSVRRAAAALAAAALFVPAAGLGQRPDLPAPREVPGAAGPTVTPPATTGAAAPSAGVPLARFVEIGLERNPRLAQAAYQVDAASGRALQAGLYPNPTLNVQGDELGDRTGTTGIISAPVVAQEIVTAGKLRLGRQAGQLEADQAALALAAERYNLFASVRQTYYDVLTLQERAEILAGLVQLAEQSAKTSQQLLDAKQVARLDLVQLEVELERFRAEEDAVRQELAPAFRRLTAAVGVSDLPLTSVAGSLEEALPDYDLEKGREFVLAYHPDVQAARLGVERAQVLLRRAEVEPIPNVTLNTGYVRQNENRSNDWQLGVTLPVPVWNRNQGNVFAAKAEVGRSVQEVGRVGNDLVARLATAYRAYAAARQRAERYGRYILPKSREAYQLSLKAFQGGQFEYLRVLVAQRDVGQARLEYNRALGEAWRAAAELSGLLLQEQWPSAPPPPAAPAH